MSSAASGTAVIAVWSELWAGHGPEDRAGLLLAAVDALGAYEVRAAKRAYRRAIEQGLPEGFALRGRVFHGPASDLAVQGERLVPADGGRQALLELHRSVLERAVDGPDGDGVAYFWQIAAPYRLGPGDSRLYATWRSITGDQAPEATVRAALDRWGRDHCDVLHATGRYDFPTLRRAVEGDSAPTPPWSTSSPGTTGTRWPPSCLAASPWTATNCAGPTPPSTPTSAARSTASTWTPSSPPPRPRPAT
ncbi:hypothetical protein [Kitasatospora sp. NBC_01302]|uniref:hypothetical protein n=1 Tax=Kitasatospora sp. NBC_01302 TaxID=2903575 RepID=UPI002E0EED79|nr:hypothetical protein OG294_40760 [Kitasatospora sp. NBC_01302]